MRRKILLVGLTLVLVITSGLVFAVQKNSQDVPPGVHAKMWIALTENAGIALTDKRAPASIEGMSVIQGTLMVKIGGV